MKRVCVIIRVYNRVEDLANCINIIRDTWKLFEYYIIVVANGSSKGYTIDEDCKRKTDRLIDLEHNAGHIEGNSQLLLEGLPYIPDDCKYTILLEADNWMYGDELIKKYIDKMDAGGAVWASAQFFSYVLNLATDFAIVDSNFIRTNKQILAFRGIPEYYVANYLKNNGFSFIYINENGPVNLPRYIKRYFYAPKGRFYVFPKSKMVTHHIEHLAGGMDEKKFYFNVLAGTSYFNLPFKALVKSVKFSIAIAKTFFYLIPHKSWFIKQKK